MVRWADGATEYRTRTAPAPVCPAGTFDPDRGRLLVRFRSCASRQVGGCLSSSSPPTGGNRCVSPLREKVTGRSPAAPALRDLPLALEQSGWARSCSPSAGRPRLRCPSGGAGRYPNRVRIRLGRSAHFARHSPNAPLSEGCHGSTPVDSSHRRSTRQKDGQWSVRVPQALALRTGPHRSASLVDASSWPSSRWCASPPSFIGTSASSKFQRRDRQLDRVALALGRATRRPGTSVTGRWLARKARDHSRRNRRPVSADRLWDTHGADWFRRWDGSQACDPGYLGLVKQDTQRTADNEAVRSRRLILDVEKIVTSDGARGRTPQPSAAEVGWTAGRPLTA